DRPEQWEHRDALRRVRWAPIAFRQLPHVSPSPSREQDGGQLAPAFEGGRVFRPPRVEQLQELLASRLVAPLAVAAETLQQLRGRLGLLAAGGQRHSVVDARLVVGGLRVHFRLELADVAGLAGYV